MKSRINSVFIFLLSAAIAWGINITGQIFFPSGNLLPFVARTAFTLAADVALLYISKQLLVHNGLSPGSLGVSISARSIKSIFMGILVGISVVILLAALLNLLVPFHFVRGSSDIVRTSEDAIGYVVGNTLEELIFRGFLFVILWDRIGWRWAALITAIPFGLFHLQGSGLDDVGIKMVITTTCFSFIFSFSYVYFQSLWASAAIHIVSNICLHAVSGLDGEGRALLNPVFEKDWPSNYDPAFVVAIATSVMISGLLYYMIISTNDVHKKLAGN